VGWAENDNVSCLPPVDDLPVTHCYEQVLFFVSTPLMS